MGELEKEEGNRDRQPETGIEVGGMKRRNEKDGIDRKRDYEFREKGEARRQSSFASRTVRTRISRFHPYIEPIVSLENRITQLSIGVCVQLILSRRVTQLQVNREYRSNRL